MSFSRSAIASLRAIRAIRLQVRYLATTPRLRRDVDPFPLPLSDPELAAAASRVPSSGDKLSPEDAELLMPKPLDRTGEDEKTIRARLVYQTRKRGMLEGDLLLSTFARDSLDAMSLAEMQEFDKLLDENDWDIYYWSIDKREAPARWKDTELLQRLKRHARNEGRVVRIMPALVDKA